MRNAYTEWFFPALENYCVLLSIGSCTRVSFAECDPSCPLQACKEGIRAVVIEIVVPEIHILVSSTDNFNINMEKLKNSALSGNTGRFANEVDLAGSDFLEGMKVDSLRPQNIARSRSTERCQPLAREFNEKVEELHLPVPSLTSTCCVGVGRRFRPPGKQSSVCFEVPMKREIMARVSRG